MDKQVDFEVPLRRYVTKKIIAISPKSSIKETVKKMVEFDISAIAIEEEENVIGFFTDSDIKKRVVAGGISPSEEIETVMTKELITADIGSTIKKGLALMAEHNIKHLLITEEEKIVGLLTLRDIEDVGRQKLETYIARE